MQHLYRQHNFMNRMREGLTGVRLLISALDPAGKLIQTCWC